MVGGGAGRMQDFSGVPASDAWTVKKKKKKK